MVQTDRLSGWRVTFAILIALPSVAPRQAASPAQSSGGAQYTIRENVDFVVLHPTVQNRSGNPVSGLGKDDFQVYEDGVLQQIKYFGHEDIPVTVGLVVDNSGSMGQKRPEVIAAALAFARSSNPEDEMFAITFNEHASFGLPERTPFTDSADHLEIALARIASSGMTALYDAVAAGLDHLKKGTRDKKVLIVISDGGDNASKRDLAQIMTMAGQSDAIIYTVGLFDRNDPDRNPGVLRQFARATGGVAFFPSQLRQVVPISERIARDIRNQYTVAYTSTNRKQDGTHRSIQVKAVNPRRGRLTVRVRTGYYAHTEPQRVPESRATQE